MLIEMIQKNQDKKLKDTLEWILARKMADRVQKVRERNINNFVHKKGGK